MDMASLKMCLRSQMQHENYISLRLKFDICLIVDQWYK